MSESLTKSIINVFYWLKVLSKHAFYSFLSTGKCIEISFRIITCVYAKNNGDLTMILMNNQ